MKIITTDELNAWVKDDPAGLIKRSEKAYSDKILEIATTLRENVEQKPIVLLSGPSGSGKTTTALRIEQILDGWGFETHTLSMDSYFLPIKDPRQAVDENGKIDYESPLRLDIELLNKHLEMLANCEEIQVPKYDFKTQTRKAGHSLKRHKNELVVIEGIHALNPDITGNSMEFATGIYVSVRTRLQNTKGELLHPSKIRLMRRMMRDIEQRGRIPEETLDMYKSVERGENLYIMPYKHRAHFEIDSFFDYEVAIYKSIISPVMERISETYKDYERFSDILKFLNEISPLEQTFVPKNSLVREFIGGSDFRY